MNNNSTSQSQQYYSQEVPMDSVQQQQQRQQQQQQQQSSNNSQALRHQIEQQQQQQANYTEPVVKTENETQSGDTSTTTKETDKKKRAGPKRRKVTHACVYCRRSHMTCDDGRPCQRCIKRSIGHLCHDEPKGSHGTQQMTGGHNALPAGILTMQSLPQEVIRSNAYNNLAMQAFTYSQLPATPLTFASEHMGHEFTVISDFLESVDGNTQNQQVSDGNSIDITEKFLLTAADPSDGPSEERLTQVINAKFEAGILKPYNYVNGYARLQKYMENNMTSVSRQRILNSLGTFRPAFRNVAQSLTDIDLVLVEANFERLLLV